MPKNSDTTVLRDKENEIVTIQNTATQKFSEENFIDVYEDNKQNYENLMGKIDHFEEEREELFEENEEQLDTLNKLLDGEEVDDPELDESTFQVHQKLQQFRDQLDQLHNQRHTLEEQLEEMSDVAVELDEEVEDFEPE